MTYHSRLSSHAVSGGILSKDVATCSNSPSELLNAMYNVTNWCNKWKMNLNVLKTMYLILHSPITVDNTSVLSTPDPKSVRDLGV